MYAKRTGEHKKILNDIYSKRILNGAGRQNGGSIAPPDHTTLRF